jgi:hypothetical protein
MSKKSPLDPRQLTKKQKLQMLDLIEEKKRRDRLRPNHYTPNSGQASVHASDAVERYVTSGNGSGKTALLANEVIWAAEGYNPVTKKFTRVPARIIVVLDSPAKVSDVWLKELRKWAAIGDDQLHKDGKPYFRRISWQNGSSLTFYFWEQEEMAFESVEADFFVFDEPCPRKHYVALKRAGRTRGRVARYLLGGTPISAAWLRIEVYEPWSRGERPNTECFRYGTEVNRSNLADGYIESFSAVLSEKERGIRLEGAFYDIEGLALAHLFKRATHTCPTSVRLDFKERAWPTVIAIDPHPQKRNHAVLLGTDKLGQLFILEELAVKATPRQFARKILDTWCQQYRIVDIVCDNYGSGQQTGGEGFMSFIEVARSEGMRVRPTRYEEKQDDAFIERIQEALLPARDATVPLLRVVEDCKGTISDFENVEWVKHRDLDMHKPKLNISNRDFLSCVKYALATNPTTHRPGSSRRIIGTASPVSYAGRSKTFTNKRRA